MSRLTRPGFLVATVVLSACIFTAATKSETFDALAALPPGAALVVTAANPANLVANMTGFLERAGFADEAAALAGFMDNLADRAERAGTDDGDGEDASMDAAAGLFAALDVFRRPVLALYPPVDAAGGSPGLVAYLPLRAGMSEDSVAGLVRTLASGTTELAVNALPAGYIEIVTRDMASRAPSASVDGSAPAALPAGGTRFSRLAGYGESSFILWVDPALAAKYAETVLSGLGSAFSAADDSGSGSGYEGDDGYGGSDEYDPYADVDAGSYDIRNLVDNLLIQTLSRGSSPDAPDYAETDAPMDDGSDGELDAGEYAEDYDWDTYDTDDAMVDAGDSAEDSDGAGGDDADGTAEAPWVYEDDEDAGDAVPGESGLSFSGAPMLKELQAAVGGSLDGIASVEMVLTVDGHRAWLRFGVEPEAGSELARVARGASSGDRNLPYLAHCDADALVSAAWSMQSGWAYDLTEKLYGVLLPDKAFLATAMKAAKAISKASGTDGGVSVNLDLSAELVRAVRSGASPDDKTMAALLSRGVSVSMSGVLKLTDRQGYRDALATIIDMVKDPSYAGMMADAGFLFGVDRKVGILEGKPYDSYRYTFDTIPGADEVAGGQVLLSAMGPLLSPSYVYDGDNAYVGLGTPQSVLKGMNRVSRPSLRSDKAFRALKAGAPADTRGLVYISTRALSRLLLRLLPEDAGPLGFSSRDLSGLLVWGDATAAQVGFGLGFGAEDIRAVRALAEAAD